MLLRRPLRQGLDYEWCRAPDIGLPAPDLTLFLSLSAEEAARRGGYGRERYEAVSIQTKVRELFVRLGRDTKVTGSASSGPSALTTSSPIQRWMELDAGKSVDEVAAQCRAEAQRAIETVHGEDAPPVGRLFVE